MREQEHDVWIALGSNLGDRSAFLRLAREGLAALPDTWIVAASDIEETVPLGGPSQGDYLNQMVHLRTGLDPRMLLTACQALEVEAGRDRGERWGPRTLDVDIVLYGECQVHEPDLDIPHPGLPHREFWLRQLAALGKTP